MMDREEIKTNSYKYKLETIIDMIFDKFEAELKAKDEVIEIQNETINLLSDAMKKWMEEVYT